MQECRGKGTSCVMKAYLTIEIHHGPKCEYIKSSRQIFNMLTRVDVQPRNVIPAHVLVLFSVLHSRELLYEQLPGRSSCSYRTAATLKRRQSRTHCSWCPLKVSSFRSTVTNTSILTLLSPSQKHGRRRQRLTSALRWMEQAWWWYTSHHVTWIPEATGYFSMPSRTLSGRNLAGVYIPCFLRCPSLPFLLPSILATPISHR
jgi:hypothetical protein